MAPFNVVGKLGKPGKLADLISKILKPGSEGRCTQSSGPFLSATARASSATAMSPNSKVNNKEAKPSLADSSYPIPQNDPWLLSVMRTPG